MYINGKMRPVEIIAGIGGGEIKKIGEGVNSTMIYLIYFKNFLVNAIMYPQQTINK
jgi:hypothetical protein